jgi:hypothetical protein
MAISYTEADFDRLSWHDCHIWRVELCAGDPEEGDWTSDLVLDVDYIVEWLCRVGGVGQFRVAPATLAFHGVTDLRINIDWGRSGFQCSLHDSRRYRTRADSEPESVPDRPYYRWIIRLNGPNQAK